MQQDRDGPHSRYWQTTHKLDKGQGEGQPGKEEERTAAKRGPLEWLPPAGQFGRGGPWHISQGKN